MKYPYVLILLALLLNTYAHAQDGLSRRDVITGLKVPVEITWGPDDWIWFAEKGGRVGRVDPSTGEMRTVYQVVDLWESNESGLLGMAVYPTLRDTPYVFLAWTYYEESEVRLKLVRYKFDGTTLRDSTLIFHRVTANAYTNGGRLTITPDRKVLMTVGDADQPMFAQSPFFLGGKVLRMNFDGSVPSDNPSRLAPTPINLLWSWGHRDGRGIVALPNGTVFSVEQGRDSIDELNVIQRRRNYGWPRVEGRCDQVAEMKFCSDSNVVQPARMWVRNIYPSGLDYYNNPAIPEFANSLLMVTLDEKDLRRLTLNGTAITSETTHFDDEFGRLRDLCVAPDGRIFLATSNRDERGIGTNYAGADKIVEIGGNRAIALLGTPQVSGDSALTFYAGDSVRVSFTASSFDASNVFSLQISDGTGSFTGARTLGTLAGRSGGVIAAMIPCDTSGLDRYRFRIASSSPPTTKTDVTSGFRIVPAPIAVISPSRSLSICPGDSVVFRARLGVENRWSTGAVGDSIVVRDTGSYHVISYANGCPRYSDTISVSFAPLPQPRIQLLGTATLDAGARFSLYRWYRNDTLLVDAIGRSINVTIPGRYVVSVRNDQGCWNTSEPYEYQFSSIASDTERRTALRLYPHPASDRVMLEADMLPGGAVDITISDARGSELQRFRHEASRGSYRRNIDLRGMASGAYVVTVRCGEVVRSARLDITR